MKYYLLISILFIYIATSCNQNNSKNVARKNSKSSIDTIANKPIDPESKKDVQSDNLGDFSHLVPIHILDSKSKNVYEKYGIDFDGNCYNCDLAFIRINKKNFDIVNVCDKNDFFRNKNFVYEVTPNELRIKIEKNEYIFSKIETAPVYELKVVGEKLSLKKKKITKFYTQQKELHKFKQHDCGEFNG